MKKLLAIILFFSMAAAVLADNSLDDLTEEDLALCRLVVEYYTQGKFDLAMNYLEKIKDKPGEEEFLCCAGDVYFFHGRIEQAEQMFKQATAYEKNAFCALAVLYEDQGKFDLVAQCLRQVDKSEAESLFWLGRTCLQMRKREWAEKYFKQAAEAADKGDSDIFYGLGNMYKKLGKLDLAEFYYKKALDKQDSLALKRLGKVYEKQGKLGLAEHYFKMAFDECNFFAAIDLGILYYRQGEFDLAEYYFKQAGWKCDLAECYLKQIAYAREVGTAEVLSDLEVKAEYKKRKIDEKEGLALCNLGLVYERQNKFDLAKYYYKQAADKGDVNDFLFDLGLDYESQDKLDLAEQCYKRAADKGYAAALYDLGVVYKKKGKQDLAEEYFKQDHLKYVPPNNFLYPCVIVL